MKTLLWPKIDITSFWLPDGVALNECIMSKVEVAGV